MTEVITYRERAEISNLECQFELKSVNGRTYDMDWGNAIYINRIGDKTRILMRSDNMRNVIEIKCKKMILQYLYYYVQSKLPTIDRLRMGTCQQYMRHGDLLEILTGVFPNERKC